MAEEIINNDQITIITRIIPSLINKTTNKILFDYDKDVDVLYISFERLQKVTDAVMQDNGVIRRYHGGKNTRNN